MLIHRLAFIHSQQFSKQSLTKAKIAITESFSLKYQYFALTFITANSVKYGEVMNY